MKFFCLKIALGLALGESWPLLSQPQKNTNVQQGMLLWEGLPRQICINHLWRKQGCKLMGQIYQTIRLRQRCKELVPWERTPWNWSKHLKFRPSWIMTVPQRLCFSAQLSNCNLARCWHIELSILGLPHLSISIHLTNSFNCSMKFFCLKIALGLALGESWPLLAQPQKNTDVHKGLLLWESFPKRTCKSYLRRKQGCKLMDQVYTTSLLRQPWEELVPWERTPWHWSKHLKFRPSWIMTVPQRLCFSAQLSSCNLATCWHIELSNTPPRNLYAKKLFKTKGAPSGWRYWGARMVQIYQRWDVFNVFQQMTVLSSHVQVVWGVFSKMWKQLHRMIVCLKLFEEHQIFRSTPCGKRIGYSMMAVFSTEFSIVLTVIIDFQIEYISG